MISNHDQVDNKNEKALDELASILVQIAYSISGNQNKHGKETPK